MKRVLLLSAGNPCRALVAEALVKKYLNTDKQVDIIGAGMTDSGKINSHVLENLKEEGLDVSIIAPRKLEEVLDESFDLIVTLCDHSRENCPVFPGSISTIHMGFPIIDEDEAACKELFIKIKENLIPLLRNEIA